MADYTPPRVVGEMEATPRPLDARLFTLVRGAAVVVGAAFAAFGLWRWRFPPSHPADGGSAANEASSDRHTPLALAVDFSNAPTVDPTTQLPHEVPRRILALFDSTETLEEEDDYGKTFDRPIDSETALAHRFAEVPLSYLGLAVDYWDVDSGRFPTAAQMRRYRGVLVWFDDEKMRYPEPYLRWLASTARRRPIVVLEHLGAHTDLSGTPAQESLVRRAFASIGGRYLGNWTDDASQIAVVRHDDELVGFERPLPPRLDFYQQYEATGAEVYLELERLDRDDSHSDVIWIHPNGAFVLASLAVREDRLGDRYVTRWLVNPFELFERAFQLDGLPRPDYTTLGGRRIFYSHVDGDGLEHRSKLDYRSRCGAIVRDEIFKHYDLPFTASVVVGLVAPPKLGLGAAVEVDVARSVFALDNVEIGSHGLAHPMDWRAGQVPGYSKEEVSVPGLPDYALSAESEVAASVEYINEVLAPPGKKCTIMLWTGWCNPTEEQLAVAYRLGLRNMNGGDPRMDDHYPSVAHMVPPIHQVGRHLQFYTSAANDYILTDDWTPPLYRFQNVIQTFERSGSPRRLAPVNVYFHFYIAGNFPAFASLRTVLDWVDARPFAPVFASEYIDIARDFRWVRIARPSPRTWVIAKGRALRTVRFDDPTIAIDLNNSEGVLGFMRDEQLRATYVHLDGGQRAVIALGESQPELPYLVEASHIVDSFQPRPNGLEYTTRGVGEHFFRFAGLRPGSYESVAVDGNREVARSEVVVGRSGVGEIRMETGPSAGMTIRLRRL